MEFSMADFCSFNSMIVRLKVVSLRFIFFQRMKFQFYDSPIKSIWRTRNGMNGSSFNSMIVRLKACLSFRSNARIACFNSMIVRLKAAAFFASSSDAASFNSMIVRLKARIRSSSASTSPGFQFYDSPIKRNCYKNSLFSYTHVSIL